MSHSKNCICSPLWNFAELFNIFTHPLCPKSICLWKLVPLASERYHTYHSNTKKYNFYSNFFCVVKSAQIEVLEYIFHHFHSKWCFHFQNYFAITEISGRWWFVRPWGSSVVLLLIWYDLTLFFKFNSVSFLLLSSSIDTIIQKDLFDTNFFPISIFWTIKSSFLVV